MPKFNWEGRTRSGETRSGVIEADDADAASQALRTQGIQPTKVRKASRQLSIRFGSGVGEKDLVVFTRQLATMIDAGLPLVQCLDILSKQTENRNFGRIIGSVKASVESGATFSDALRRHPRVFDDLYVNLIAAGEVGGILDTILHRLSTYIEKAAKLKRQVKGAMVYPISILCVAVGVIVVLLTKVIPVFENMFKEMRAGSLPAPTKVVINLSNGFIANWYWFLIAAIVLAGAFTVMMRTEKGRDLFDAFLLKIPVIGNVLRKVVVARFTRTLGTLLSSGVPILDALDICARTSGNRIVERGVLFARQKISEGKDLAGPLAEARVFPPMVVQMIGVGEQTGAMDAMLQKIADFYEEEVDVAVASLTSLMEPVMMVFLGGIIGGLIIAMYLPIFELAGNIRAE
ncbi:MAG: type II secretion system F family protein [Deltaproteobacteria bacterium]|nr:MAG: type II secretion system F family protein [Deltaproteobacteria bacterium]